MGKGKRLKRDSSQEILNIEIGKTIQHFRNVNWSIEIVKAILIGFIVFFISTMVLGIITYFSPGEYSDIRLREYLLTEVSKQIKMEYKGNEITVSRTIWGIQNGASIDDIIVLCGDYSINTRYVDGYYICIFERKPKNFFNDLFGTLPRYSLTFIRTIQSYGPDSLYWLNCKAEDVDNDGLMEIRIEYLINFADRDSMVTAIIECEDYQWKIISPDFSTFKEEVSKIANKDVYPAIDGIPLTNPLNSESEILYGLSNEGYIRMESNPWTGGIDWLYCVTVRDYDRQQRQYAFAMLQLANNEMIREPDWNVGSIYFPEHEDRKIEEFVAELWGWSPHMEYNIPWRN